MAIQIVDGVIMKAVQSESIKRDIKLIVGSNGSGKTQFLRTLFGKDEGLSSLVIWENGNVLFDFNRYVRYDSIRCYFDDTFNDFDTASKTTVLSDIRLIYPFIKDILSDDGEITIHNEVSDSMLKVIYLIILLTYISSPKNRIECLLINDVGLGVDWGACSNFIELLIDKSKSLGFQLIMTTNDRIVMNSVDLKDIIVLEREGQKRAYTYQNSKDIFDKFEFSGLDNFSFVTSCYYKQI
jgi:predicted ATPase